VTIRSVLTCETKEVFVINAMVKTWQPDELPKEVMQLVLYAAQSIGEPGTQLTLTYFPRGWYRLGFKNGIGNLLAKFDGIVDFDRY
jgi:hypothetical protein